MNSTVKQGSCLEVGDIVLTGMFGDPDGRFTIDSFHDGCWAVDRDGMMLWISPNGMYEVVES